MNKCVDARVQQLGGCGQAEPTQWLALAARGLTFRLCSLISCSILQKDMTSAESAMLLRSTCCLAAVMAEACRFYHSGIELHNLKLRD